VDLFIDVTHSWRSWTGESPFYGRFDRSKP